MIVVDKFRGKQVIVLGLGLTGTAAVKSLIKGGANVLAWDDNITSAPGINLCDPIQYNWQSIAALILSPGIPQTHTLVRRAQKAGIPILSDIDLLVASEPKARFVGITGTNGKTTTTALLGSILSKSKIPYQVGGNIGKPVLALNPLGNAVCVLELSSYHLAISRPLPLDVAVLLNIASDHLPYHGSQAEYVAAKQKIFAGQKANQLAVVGVDGAVSKQIYDDLNKENRNVVAISRQGQEYLVNSVQHWQNVVAAYTVASHLGVSKPAITEGISSFKGLPHRQEPVTTNNRITFINDSKATNTGAAKLALQNYDNIFWILGGRFKEEHMDELLPYLGKVQHAFIIGDSMDELSKFLAGKTKITKSKTLDEAVQQAHNAAVASQLTHPVILLSPACESFDQFKNFEHRGEMFKTYVQEVA